MPAHRSTLSHCRTPGFTLIEVLVVLLIVGIIVAMAGLALGAGGARADTRDFAAVIGQLVLARDLAETSGRATAVRYDETPAGLVFQRDDRGQWQRVPQEGAAAHGASDLRIIRIEHAGRTVPLNHPILFGPDGVGHGFVITVSSHGVVRTVVADAANAIRLLTPAAAGERG